jgi:hypothetical protein
LIRDQVCSYYPDPSFKETAADSLPAAASSSVKEEE